VRGKKAGLRIGGNENEGSENGGQRMYEQDEDEELLTTRR
jgi:hypothetical protein